MKDNQIDATKFPIKARLWAEEEKIKKEYEEKYGKWDGYICLQTKDDPDWPEPFYSKEDGKWVLPYDLIPLYFEEIEEKYTCGCLAAYLPFYKDIYMRSVLKIQCFIGRARKSKDSIFCSNLDPMRSSTYDFLMRTADYIHDFKERFGRDVPFDIWGGLEKTKQFDETINRNVLTRCDLSKFAGTRHNKEVINNYEKHLYSHLDFTKIFDFKNMKELVPGATILLRNYICIMGDIYDRNNIVSVKNGNFNVDTNNANNDFSHRDLLIECFGGLENFNKFNEYVIDKFVEDFMPDSHKSLFNNNQDTIDYFIISAFMCEAKYLDGYDAFGGVVPRMIEHLSFTSDEYKMAFKNRYFEKAINLIYSNYSGHTDWLDLVMRIPNVNCKKVFSNKPYTTNALALFSQQIKKCNLSIHYQYLPNLKGHFLIEVLPTFLDRKFLNASDLVLIEDKLGANLKKSKCGMGIAAEVSTYKMLALQLTKTYEKVKSEVLQDEINKQKNLDENIALDSACEETEVEHSKTFDSFDLTNAR